MNQKFHTPILFCLSFLLLSCTNAPREVTPAFYHWRSTFDLGSSDEQLLDSLGVEKLYTKFFDVVWDPHDGAIPAAKVNFRKVSMERQLVPAVFITNEVFQNIAEEDLQKLAADISGLIAGIHQPEGAYREYQIDCDWSGSTREKYFSFLREFKKQIADAELSVTLRLHQLKYQQSSGIPPADRTMLMFYNVNPPDDPGVYNSILELSEARKYFHGPVAYPLPVDVVLPVFSWGLLFRYGEFQGIINNLNKKAVEKLKFFEHEMGNIYTCNTDTLYGNQYFRYGDVLRVEEVNAEQLREAAVFLSERLPQKEMTVAFYHYDPALIQNYNEKELREIYSLFGQ